MHQLINHARTHARTHVVAYIICYLLLKVLLQQGLVHLRVVKIHYLITDLVTGQLFDAVLVPPIFSQIEGFSEKL